MTARGRVVAVVSDGSALADHHAQLEPMLGRYTAVIEDLASLPVHALPLDSDQPEEAQAALRALPRETGVLFLPHVREAFASTARALTSGIPVLTDQDTTAIALAASLLTTLSRSGRACGASKAVVIGADAMPSLRPLLMAVGIGDITTWNPADAITFPLRRVVAGADVVVDLLSRTAGLGVFPADDGPVVIAPDRDRDPLLALPGLLRALAQTSGAALDVEVHHACALALVEATRPHELLPPWPDPVLTVRVAAAATEALHQPAHHTHDTRSR